MSLDLRGRDVVFIAPDYYRYAPAITRTLRQAGATVHPFGERPRGYATVRTVSRRLAGWYARWYRSRLAGEMGRLSWNTLFVIRGQILTPDWIRQISSGKSGTELLMYQWDSVRNNDYRPLVDLFDRVYSFDPGDCRANPPVRYLPLFALDSYYADCRAEERRYDIDLLFVGVLQGDRLTVLEKIAREAHKLGLSCYFHVYATWWNRIRHVFDPVFRSPFISSEQLTEKEITGLLGRSRVVVDIENPGQQGLTMRTIEVLAAGKKLLTTNRRICAEPFYKSAAIALLDRGTGRFDPAFIRVPAEPVDMEAYRLSRWIEKIFTRSDERE